MMIALSELPLTLSVFISSLLCVLQLYRRGAPPHTRPCRSQPRLSCPRRRHPTSRTPPSATRPTSTLLIPSRATCRHTTRPAHRAARSVFFLFFFFFLKTKTSQFSGQKSEAALERLSSPIWPKEIKDKINYSMHLSLFHYCLIGALVVE